MRVIITDNFNRDTCRERFLTAGIVSEDMAKITANQWNTRNSGDSAPEFARVVQDDYSLVTPEY